jgi:hypothetical protein
MVFVVLALALAAAPVATAKGGDAVVKRGPCSAKATWKLKVKADDGLLETEFEVDQNKTGRKWRVVLRQNGVKVADVVRRTKAPSGSFEVRRMLDNKPGQDRITAKATALAGGQVCKGTISF